MGVIVGFNRRRDSYQVPIAFAEHGLLDAFVTDYYYGRSLVRIPQLKHRRDPMIDPGLVRTAPVAWAAQLGWEARRKIIGNNAIFPSRRVDSSIGRRIAAVAASSPGSDLLIYSGYALQSFEQRSNARRVLFRFHPTRGIIGRSLQDDDLATTRPWLQELEFHRHYAEDRRAEAEIAASTGFVVASSMTKRGLIQDGVRADDITVVPYGCDAADSPPTPSPSPRCRFLFVGQGTQRKGLHTLLAAWKAAALPDAELIAVCMRVDPQIEAMARDMPTVTILSALTRRDLDHEMDLADTLVVPSLVEGFGLVVLEGLARGCRVIASTNTGAVDLELPASVSTIVEAGRTDALREALQAQLASFEPTRPYAADAWAVARTYSWTRFREGVREVMATA